MWWYVKLCVVCGLYQVVDPSFPLLLFSDIGPMVLRYDKPALRMAAGGGASSRRPTVGDRVVLTADYASHSDAAGGACCMRCLVLSGLLGG